MIEKLLARLKAGDYSGLRGTDLAISLPVSARLINELLAARPAGPVQHLHLQLLSENRAILQLGIDAPVIGLTQRELALRIRGDITPGSADWLHLDIEDGLRLFDKPIINLAQGLIEERLPKGVDLNSKRLSIHFSQLMHSLGYGYLLPILAAARLESKSNALVINLHLKA